MAKKQRVETTYDSGDNNTAKKIGEVPEGDWGTDVPQKNKPEDALLRIVMDDFKAARDYVKNNYEADWSDYWKCYNNIRTRRGYDGISDDFVPETFTIIESVKANIAGGKPKWTFVPMREEQTQDTTLLNQLMDFYWDQTEGQKTLNWVQDMLLYETVSWSPGKTRCLVFLIQPCQTSSQTQQPPTKQPQEMGYPKFAGYRYLTDRDTLKRRT